MASRLNKKFVMFLVAAVGAAVVLIGGLYYLNVSGSVARSIRLGDEAIAAADYRTARDYYGRAVHRQPGNLEYLKKLEDATLKMVPKTAVEAGELYRSWLGILAHAARYDGTNPEAHRRLLHELVSTARLTQQGWNNIETPALDMYRRLPESSPDRYLGKVYQSMSLFRRLRVLNIDEATAAVEDAREAVIHLPQNDLAWATLIHGELVIADKLREGGRSGPAVDEQNARILTTLADAMKAVPDGQETARMNLLTIIVATSNGILPGDRSQHEQRIAEAAEHLATVFTPEIDPSLASEAADLLAASTPDGVQRVIPLVEKLLERHPEKLNLRQSLAMLQLMAGDLDAAERSARMVMDAETLPTSVLSQLQPELRKMAGVLLMDIEGRRWAAATDDAERAARFAAMEAARNRLAELVIDKQNDTQLMRADARLAFIMGEFGKAAQLYDRLVRETNLGNDSETLYYCAIALENVNQLGLARERLIQGLQINPASIPMLVAKARLELSMGMRTEAMATARMFPESELQESEELRAIVNSINAISGVTDPLISVEQDEVMVALSRANLALMRGDKDTARVLLATALEENPDNMRLLNAAILLEIQEGKSQDARPLVQRALAQEPNNLTFRHYDAMLGHEDAVVAVRELLTSVIPDEKDLTMAMLGSLQGMKSTHEVLVAQFQRLNQPENAAASQATLNRIAEEKAVWLAKAKTLLADSPKFIEFQLNEALTAKDWVQAKQIVDRSKQLNSDQAGGSFHQGQLAFAQAAALANEGKKTEARAMLQEAVRNYDAASDHLGFASSVWKFLALSYQGLGNYTQAERALEQAYKNNPNDLDVVRAYMAILMRRGEQVRALRIVRGARQFVPNDSQLRHLWLNLEGEVGDKATAIRLRRMLATEFPDDLANALELARLLSDTDPSRETILDVEKGEPLYSEQRWSRLTIEERTRVIEQARLDWSKESDALLARLTKEMGDNLQLAVLRATVLKDRGNIEGGEQQLTDFIAAQPEGAVTGEMYIELARYQSQVTRNAQAIETLEKGLALQDPQRREVDRELGQLLMRLGRFERALTHLDLVLAAANEESGVGADTRVETQAIECLMKLRRYDEAQARLKVLTDAQGEDVITILLAANIAEGHGRVLLESGKSAAAQQKFAEQKELYVRAQTLDPANTMPYVLQAQWYVAEWQRTERDTALNDALLVLDAADKVRAGASEVSTLRVAIFKSQGETSAAIGELRRLLERYPDQHLARRELAQLYVQTNQHDAAITLMNEGIRTNPSIGLWHEALGDLLRLIKNDLAGAMASYTRAYQLSPGAQLLAKLSDTALAGGAPDCRGTVQRIEATKDPANGVSTWLDENPALRESYARALNCIKRIEEARTQLREAFAKRQALIAAGDMDPSEIGPWFTALAAVFAMPDIPGLIDASAAEAFALELTGANPNLYAQRALAAVWISAGDPTLARAIELQQAAISQCPADNQPLWLEVQNELANLYYNAKRFEDAAAVYEKMVQAMPDRVDVLNNLAYLTANELKNPAKALPLAERALKAAPENPAVLDTAGWVCFLAGQYEKALEHLRESVRLQRAAGTFLHLAETQLRLGDLNGARQSVDDASRMEPDAAQQQEIQRIAAEIRKAAGQGR